MLKGLGMKDIMSTPNKDLSADRFDEKFCKIMDIIGDFEGKRLLAEKDELDRNGFTIPESLDKRCLEIICRWLDNR